MKTFKDIREKMKDPCWKGYRMLGTKKKGDHEVPNCVPVKEQSWKSDHDENQPETSSVPRKAGWTPKKYKIDIAKRFNQGVREEAPAWTRKAGKNPTGGLNKKGIDSYRREHPGSHLSLAVTTPPSKLDPKGKAAGRRRSFCARMGGSKGPMKKPNGEPTRKALALRKWHC